MRGIIPERGRESVEDDADFFLDIKGVIHKEFVPPRIILNAVHYFQVLKRLKARMPRVRPDENG